MNEKKSHYRNSGYYSTIYDRMIIELVINKLHEVTPLETPCLLLLLQSLGMGRNNLRKILTFLKL